jgi:hypothetical protein
MQHWITGGMMSTAVIQLLQRCVKRQPFGDPKCQLAFFLKLLISQKVRPVRVVLGRGNTPVRGIEQCQLNRFAALSCCWFWDSS